LLPGLVSWIWDPVVVRAEGVTNARIRPWF